MAISSSQLKIYSDSACTTVVKTVNGTTAATQTLTVTGLSEHTQYWAKAEATNQDNVTGYSTAYTFTTLYAEPTISVVASNITSNGARLTFSYNGNYPIDTSNYTGILGQYWPKNDPSHIQTVEFHNLDNGTPETFTLSGLASNTIYVAEFNVEYYNGEVTDQIEFTTLAESAPTVTITGVSNITPTGATVAFTIA